MCLFLSSFWLSGCLSGPLKEGLKSPAVHKRVEQDEILSDSPERCLVIGLSARPQRGRLDRRDLVRLRSGGGRRIIVVLIEIGQGEAVKLRAEFLTAQFSRRGTFQALEEETPDLAGPGIRG